MRFTSLKNWRRIQMVALMVVSLTPSKAIIG